MTTARSTKGRTVGIAVQSSLTNQPSSFGEIRTHEAITFPTEVSLAEVQPNMGHNNAFDWTDEPIVFEGVRENGMTIPVAFRRGATTTQPPIATLAESGGCGVYASADDTIATYTDEGDWTNTGSSDDDEGYFAHLVELDSGLYWPTLMASVDSSNSIPSMALPSASSATNTLTRMHTIFAQSTQVDNSKLLAAKVNTRGAHTSTEDLAWLMYGCSLGTFGDISIEPQGQLTMSPTFHVADVEQTSDAIAPETFIDTTFLQRNQGEFRFEFGTADENGDIASGFLELLTATITLGHTTTPIPGDGSASCLNSIQGYMASTPEQPKVVLELLMDKTYWETFTTTGNLNKYLGFVWPTTNLNVPAYGIWLPNCYQIASPVADVASENYLKVTVTYGANAALSGVGSGETGASPWYMAIHGQAS